MTEDQKQAVRDLAISYAAFSRAVRQEDARGVQVWARILKTDQERTGVEMRSAYHLDQTVAAFTK